LDLAYVEGVLHLNDTRAQIEQTMLRATGTVSPGPEEIDVSVVLHSPNLDAVDPYVPQALRGAVQVRARIEGDARGTTVRAAVEGSDVAFEAYRTQALTANLTYNGGNWPEAVMEDARVRAEGSFD